VLSAALLLTAMAQNSALPPIFGPNETILFQGDSITDGNRGRSADPNHILGHGYVFSIASRYGEAFPNLGLSFVNRGISGNTVADLATRWTSDALDLKPDVVSVLVGINDIHAFQGRFASFSAEPIYQTYDRLLADTLRARPNVKLILGQPFVLDVGMVAKDPDGWHAALAKMDTVVERLASKYHAPIVHYQRAFNEALKRAPADHWIWDGIHPTYSGHGIMADEWIRTYNDFYRSPLLDPARNSAIDPQVNFERDSYDWLHRHADILDTQAKGDVEVVMIGDSITHFWSGEPRAATVNGKQAWKDTFADLKVLNMGFGWDRTQNVLWRLAQGELKGLRPKTIVLNIGTNNLVGDSTARENSPAETAAGIEAVVAVLRERVPTARLFVMGVFPRGFEKDNPLDLRIRELNALLTRSLAGRENVTFFDIGGQLREKDGSVSPARFFDGTHPTEAGYIIWGQALRKAGYLP
jgi:lysophospholipase L1-like esterase